MFQYFIDYFDSHCLHVCFSSFESFFFLSLFIQNCFRMLCLCFSNQPLIRDNVTRSEQKSCFLTCKGYKQHNFFLLIILAISTSCQLNDFKFYESVQVQLKPNSGCMTIYLYRRPKQQRWPRAVSALCSGCCLFDSFPVSIQIIKEKINEYTV